MRGAASIGDAVALRSSGNERLGSVWSVLREILLGFSFAEMKTLTASAGLPTGKLSHLRQTSGSGRSTGKGELADAIDGLFNELDAVDQDRVTANLIIELLRRRSADEERLTELLERVGWTLIGDQPSPPRRATGSAAGTGRGGLATAARRYRDGDLDGAMTAIAETVDSITEAIYTAHALGAHRRTGYHARVIAAHRARETAFRAALVAMDDDVLERTWKAQERAVNGAAEVLAALEATTPTSTERRTRTLRSSRPHFTPRSF